jgi:hypothetical protein
MSLRLHRGRCCGVSLMAKDRANNSLAAASAPTRAKGGLCRLAPAVPCGFDGQCAGSNHILLCWIRTSSELVLDGWPCHR